MYLMFAINIENQKKLKYHILKKKTLCLSIVYSKCGHEYGKLFKEKESIEILKILGSINTTDQEFRKNKNQELKLEKAAEIRKFLFK